MFITVAQLAEIGVKRYRNARVPYRMKTNFRLKLKKQMKAIRKGEPIIATGN